MTSAGSAVAARLKLDTRVDAAIHGAVDHLLELQSETGYWWAELESNVTITAEHLFLRHILGNPDPSEARAAAAHILKHQRADGTWTNWHDGPAELSTTVEAYLALKMAGVSHRTPEMTKARAFIRSRGGVEKVRVFTKIWLAMMGEWDWRGLPVLPAEFVLLPQWFPISVYSFGCWARQTIVPMSIIMNEKPVFPLLEDARIDELFVNGRGNADLTIRPAKPSWTARAFLLLDKALRLHERLPWKPLRRRALEVAERWVLDRQEADGSWGGIQPPWVYSLIALKLRGHSLDEGPLHDGFAGFYGPEGFAIRGDGGFRLQSCLSPVWDTGLALMALQDASLKSDHPGIAKASEWLLGEQIFAGGDWQTRCDARPGGWAFEFANAQYPDTDDTAVVMIALLGANIAVDEKQWALDRGLEWLVGMQSRNGGWGAFDRNNTQTWTRQIPFCDFGEVIDPPSVDVTAHVIECLGRLGRRLGDPVVDRAVAYLKSEQEPDGAWYGRWGVNLTYGIGGVLPALEAIGEDMSAGYVRRAVDWLVAHQNEDGGWGEKIEGYYDPAWRGRGPSSASQTAWALLGLIAAGQAAHPTTARGIEYLMRGQSESGGWDEEAFTGAGFPTDFMIRYHLYRDVFPLMALGRYRRTMGVAR
jgi:squalene-hopene/tetraprenyl-beta-curcumene cyclase